MGNSKGEKAMSTRTNTSIRQGLFIGGFIVIALVIFGVWVASRVNQEMGKLLDRTDQPQFVALHYYEALRNQNYAAAYADLDAHVALNGQPLDQQRFIQLAAQADAQQGEVSAYNLLEAQGDATGFNARLTRGSQSYFVHLQLQQVGRVWKISTLDGL